MLEIVGTSERLEGLLTQLETEIDILQVEKRIRGRVKKQMEKSQRDYYLNEQVKAIQKELGEGEEGADIEELEKKIIAAHMPEARKKADAELKLSSCRPCPPKPRWCATTSIRSSIFLEEEEQDQQLDQQRRDGAGQRPLRPREGQGTHPEYLAVQQRVDKVKAPILCLVGPPGVGKTSLGQSIAATNRKFVRMALGGVRDEAEIRGHRRTYIGSMPGKIVRT